MKKLNALVIAGLLTLLGCSHTHNEDVSKPERSISSQEERAQPPRTFNQFHHDWDY